MRWLRWLEAAIGASLRRLAPRKKPSIELQIVAKNLAGSKWPCFPGLLLIRLVDRTGRSFPPGYIVGLYLRDGGHRKEILLGLGGGILRQQGREIIDDGGKVWLTER